MFKVLLVVAAIPVALIGLVHLAIFLLRLAKKHRGAVAAWFAEEDLRGRLGDAFDGWLESSSSSETMGHDSGGDHHVETGHDSGHSH